MVRVLVLQMLNRPVPLQVVVLAPIQKLPAPKLVVVPPPVTIPLAISKVPAPKVVVAPPPAIRLPPSL